VPVDGARTFAEAFYRYLAEGHPVWEAVRQARVAMGAQSWVAGLPVLYASGDHLGVIPPQPDGEVQDEAREERARLGWRQELVALRAATRFYGRESELVQIGEALALDACVVTLHGPGGIGKSALAHEAVTRFGWRFPAGVYSVSLANIKDSPSPSPVLVLGRAMRGDRFSELSPEAQEYQLIEAIRSQPCLVVVDNAEDALWSRHESEEAVRSLRALRAATGGQGVLLVTSQEQLGWAGERVIGVGGLDPRSSRSLFGDFLDGRELASEDEELLADTLHRLEHHPLAIRLVAPAWTESGLTLAELSSQLEPFLPRAIDVLAERAQHQSLDACFRYAYEALQEPDRTWLCRLSLFSAPFLVETATAALAGDEASLRPALQRLARRSFLWHDKDPLEKRSLFRFQPQVRPFLARQVERDGRDLAPDRRRFAAAHARIISESVKIVGSEEWAKRHPLITMTLPDLIQAVEWNEESSRPAAALALATLLVPLGFLDLAMRLYRESLAILEDLGDLWGKAATLHAMANIHVTRGDLDEAMRLYQESLAIDERLGNPQGKGATLHAMANIHSIRGDLDEAMHLYRESMAITERLGDLRGKGATLREMAHILRLRGDLDEAMRLYRESLDITERLGDLRGKGATLSMIGQLLIQSGDTVGGIRAVLESLQALARLRSADVPQVLAILGAARALLGEEKFASAWREATGDETIPEWVPPIRSS
jgi:tetratricopeptide (TPR) repeat protein